MKKVVCLGDSISDCERLSSPNGLGYGYINQLNSLLEENHSPCSIVNRGVNGFVAKRVLANLTSDCLERSPDVTTLLVGINDVGLMMNTNRTPQQQEEMFEEFVDTYRLLIEKIQEFTKSKLILLEPFIFPYPQEYANWIPFVTRMSQQIGNMASKYHCPYLLLHHRLNEAAKKDGYPAITTDGIHLTSRGHGLIAQELAKLF